MNKLRRNFLRSLATTPVLLGSRSLLSGPAKETQVPSRLKYSINAYTFNALLRSGEMTFFDMMEFASNLGLDAVDLTGYYFKDYPRMPEDKTLFELKRKAFQLGLNIPWTGIRNNFVHPDPSSRVSDIELIKDWLQVSSKLGASIMRIFTGRGTHAGYSREEVKNWMVADFQECAQYAKERGVMIGLQHHNDFLYQSDEIIDILRRVDSEWFGLILDIGSLRRGDPYKEIQKLAPYANYWFIKEKVYKDGVAQPVNMQKLVAILKGVNHTGYISFESLTEGDPKQIVTSMIHDFRSAYAKS